MRSRIAIMCCGFLLALPIVEVVEAFDDTTTCDFGMTGSPTQWLLVSGAVNLSVIIMIALFSLDDSDDAQKFSISILVGYIMFLWAWGIYGSTIIALDNDCKKDFLRVSVVIRFIAAICSSGVMASYAVAELNI